jgi:tyrosyl-tRNA synthetase
MTKVITDKKRIAEVLERGVAEVIVKEELAKKLASGKRLRIKLGIDPTGSLLHLGHAVVLRKLRDFQRLGHQVIFLIGDFTARIGDPTGRSVERKPLSDKEIKRNMADYIKQASLILDTKQVEIRYNSEWLAKLSFQEVIELTSKVTQSQVAQRADFKKRIKANADITLLEFMYPVMQGYDSVVLKADVEIGGTDQKFNLLMGRQLQKRSGQAEQDIIICPLLVGLDGQDKMSKSLDNYIGLNEPPATIYGKVMSVGDNLLEQYFALCTEVSSKEISAMKQAMKKGANPRDFKMKLAYAIVKSLHGDQAAQVAEAHFVSTVQKKEAPSAIKKIKISQGDNLLAAAVKYFGAAKSKSDLRRLFEQGAVAVNGVKVKNFNESAKSGDKVRIGKKDWFKLI